MSLQVARAAPNPAPVDHFIPVDAPAQTHRRSVSDHPKKVVRLAPLHERGGTAPDVLALSRPNPLPPINMGNRAAVYAAPEQPQTAAVVVSTTVPVLAPDQLQQVIVQGQPQDIVDDLPPLERQDHMPTVKRQSIFMPERRQATWADSRGLATMIAEEFESTGIPGKVAGAGFRFLGSTIKLGLQAGGATIHAGKTIGYGAAALVISVPGCCCECPSEVAKGLGLAAWDQGKEFVVTIISGGGTTILGVPSYFASLCCPEAVKRCELSAFRALESFCTVPSPSPQDKTLSAEIRIALKKSILNRMTESLSDAPRAPIKKLAETESAASRDKVYAKIEEWEDESCSCSSWWPALGAVCRFGRKTFTTGLMGAGTGAATGLTVTLGAAAIPFKIVGCCSESSDRVANGFGRAAKMTGKLALVTTGRIFGRPKGFMQYIFSRSCCATKDPETGANSVDDWCYTKCDKPILKDIEKCMIPKRFERDDHLNRPKSIDARIYSYINNSALMDAIRWLCDHEELSYMINEVATHRNQKSLGGNLG